jgi:hypothetical protein
MIQQDFLVPRMWASLRFSFRKDSQFIQSSMRYNSPKIYLPLFFPKHITWISILPFAFVCFTNLLDEKSW